MTETQRDVIGNLNALIQLDIDATFAYQEAIDAIDMAEIRNRMVSFRGDHERHISELSLAVRNLGGVPVERKRDVKGFMIEGFTAIRSMSGTEGALKAMRSNEKTTTQTYQKAQGLQVSDEIKVLLRRNWEDEERHLHYIEQVLAERPWQTDARKVG